MKKMKLCLMVCVMTCLFFMTTINAQERITECPNVKIIIDGNIGTYSSVPLKVNDRTMLPLKEVLTYLGVQNDDQHIIWDNVKKSVTIITDTKTIYLEAGNTIAKVNNEEVILDVAAFIYTKNNKVYIPVRFIAECLDKKVVWDGSSTSVLIRDEKSFNEVKEIMTKSNEAMSKVNKFKSTMNYDITTNDGKTISKMTILSTIQMDVLKNAMFMDMVMDMGEIDGVEMDMTMQSYQVGNTMYSKTVMTGLPGQWIKTDLTDVEAVLNLESVSEDAIEINDVICAGLVVGNSTNENEIILEGDVYLSDIINDTVSSTAAVGEGSPVAVEMNQFHIKMVMNKTTYEMKSMNLLFAMSVTVDGVKTSTESIIDIVYSDINGNFEVVVPKEVIDSAVES